MICALQRPAWQRQLPPQSSVPGRQSMVHMIPSHVGRRAAGTHAVAWQQPAGTQSLSVAHSAPSGSAALASGAGALAASRAGSGHETAPASDDDPPLLSPLDVLESLLLVQYASDVTVSAASAAVVKG